MSLRDQNGGSCLVSYVHDGIDRGALSEALDCLRQAQIDGPGFAALASLLEAFDGLHDEAQMLDNAIVRVMSRELYNNCFDLPLTRAAVAAWVKPNYYAAKTWPLPEMQFEICYLCTVCGANLGLDSTAKCDHAAMLAKVDDAALLAECERRKWIIMDGQRLHALLERKI